MKNYSLKEIERAFNLSERKLSFLIRKDLLEPIIEEGKLLVSESEIQRYLGLPKAEKKKHHQSFLKSLGPGMITGAADDDNSGVISYTQVGAQFGLSLSWMAAYLLPMMSAVQETCARIGIVTGKGLATSLTRRYRKSVVTFLVILLFITNTINIGADIGAMSSVLSLLFPVSFFVGAVLITGLIIFMVMAFSYHRYAKILKWLTLSLFAYIFAGILSRPDWLEVAKHIAVPTVQFNRDFLMAVVAVLGTTISPYLFFWQTSEEVEEERDKKVLSDHHKLAIKHEIKAMRKDTFLGMTLANIVFLFVVITAATVLSANGVKTIESAADAAQALRPFAGDLSYFLFSIGMIGVGLLAVPVLAGSSAYAIAEVLKWREGLYQRYSHARGFYGIIIFSLVVGLLMNFSGINPMKGLYYAAIVNGITAPPLLYFIFRIGSDKKIMGDFTSPRWVRIWGTITTILMGLSALLLIGFLIF